MSGSTKGVSGYIDGTASNTRFKFPIALAIDTLGTVFVADSSNRAIRKLSPDGMYRTYSVHTVYIVM